MAIISTAEYKAYAGITDSDWDTRLGVLIPAVQASLERYCGRVFEEATYTDEKYSGNGEQSLWLKNTPVTAVSAVKTVDSDDTTTTLDSGDYRFTAEGQLFRFDADSNAAWDGVDSGVSFGRTRSVVWSDAAPDNVQVTYTGGFSTVPDDLKWLMYILVDGAIDEAGENWGLGNTADGVVTRASLAPDLIVRRFADLCRPWRGSGLAVS